MTVPPAPVRVPSQRPLAPSVTSVANDEGDDEMIPGLHRSPGICLTDEENNNITIYKRGKYSCNFDMHLQSPEIENLKTIQF